MPIEARDITGAILAGGKARRMGGGDKGLMQLADRPMIEYVLASLTSQVGAVVINANRNHDKYAQFGYTVVSDAFGNYSGPLAGIATALSVAKTELVLTVPCDGPWLPPDLTSRLLNHFISQNADICVVHDGERLQPVYGLFHRRVLSDIENYLNSGERRLQTWLAKTDFVQVDFSDCPEAFININTIGEKQRVENTLSNHSST